MATMSLCAAAFGRLPDRLGLEDVRTFQVHMVATGISWPALNQTVCAQAQKLCSDCASLA